MDGSKQQRRKLLTSLTQIQLLYVYAASIWAASMVFQNNIRLIERLQRRVALRTAMAHRTISTTAFQVKAGMISVHLLTLEWKGLYIKKNSDKKLNNIIEQKKNVLQLSGTIKRIKQGKVDMPVDRGCQTLDHSQALPHQLSPDTNDLQAWLFWILFTQI